MNETVRRIIRFGFQNYWRNGWLSLAATLVLALTLFIVSVFVLQTYVIKLATQSIEDKLDLAIYINESPNEDEVQTFLTELKSDTKIKEVVYLNKEQVMDEWNKLHVDQKIKSQVNSGNNPLPRTIKVKAADPAHLDAIAIRISESAFNANIRNLSYKNNRPAIQQLIAQSERTTRNGAIVSAIFVIISVVFVYNTIRIIIRFRENEMIIMKLVGATDWFIRGPIIVEGALYGVGAGLITLGALYLYIKNNLSTSTTIVAGQDTLISDQVIGIFTKNIWLIGGGLTASAVLVAVLCSVISVYQHLKQS